MPEQRSLQFKGRVQGVGFRWTSRRIASEHGVVGWVRNEPDGSVRLVAEGESDALDRFLDDLRSSMGQFIRDESVQTAPATGGFSGFEIRH